MVLPRSSKDKPRCHNGSRQGSAKVFNNERAVLQMLQVSPAMLFKCAKGQLEPFKTNASEPNATPQAPTAHQPTSSASAAWGYRHCLKSPTYVSTHNIVSDEAKANHVTATSPELDNHKHTVAKLHDGQFYHPNMRVPIPS